MAYTIPSIKPGSPFLYICIYDDRGVGRLGGRGGVGLGLKKPLSLQGNGFLNSLS